MFVNYPRAGVSEVSLVPPFNNLRDSFEAMLNVGIAGIHFDIDFSADDTPTLALGNSGESAEVTWSHNLRFVNLVLFTGFYYCCMLFLVILLLRILMAMLSATYAQVLRQPGARAAPSWLPLDRLSIASPTCLSHLPLPLASPTCLSLLPLGCRCASTPSSSGGCSTAGTSCTCS